MLMDFLWRSKLGVHPQLPLAGPGTVRSWFEEVPPVEVPDVLKLLGATHRSVYHLFKRIFDIFPGSGVEIFAEEELTPDFGRLSLLQDVTFLFRGWGRQHMRIKLLLTCHRASNLVALDGLGLYECSQLEKFSICNENLNKLLKFYLQVLSKLLLDLGISVAFQELRAEACPRSVELPDMRKLKHVDVLNLHNCLII